MTRALQHTSRSTFFATESGDYRYWLKDGVLKLQIARKVLRKFTDSAIGKRLTRYVDLFEVGGGWFTIMPGDTSDLDRCTGFATFTNGLRVWVKALNEFFLAAFNANPTPVQVVYTNVPAVLQPSPMVNPRKLDALLAKFAH